MDFLFRRAGWEKLPVRETKPNPFLLPHAGFVMALLGVSVARAAGPGARLLPRPGAPPDAGWAPGPAPGLPEVCGGGGGVGEERRFPPRPRPRPRHRSRGGEDGPPPAPVPGRAGSRPAVARGRRLSSPRPAAAEPGPADPAGPGRPFLGAAGGGGWRRNNTQPCPEVCRVFSLEGEPSYSARGEGGWLPAAP